MFRIIFLILIGFIGGYLYARRKFKADKKLDEKQEKILELIREKGEITNNDIENALGVSDATATRYLDKLEKEGKIVQIGREGRFVKYKMK